MTVNVDHRDIRSQKTNLLHVERDRCVLVDRVEDLLVRLLDHRASLDVHAVDDDVIRIFSERLCEGGAALGVPARLQLLDVFAQRGFIRGSTLFRGNRGVLKGGDGPTLRLFRHHERKHSAV